MKDPVLNLISNKSLTQKIDLPSDVSYLKDKVLLYSSLPKRHCCLDKLVHYRWLFLYFTWTSQHLRVKWRLYPKYPQYTPARTGHNWIFWSVRPRRLKAVVPFLHFPNIRLWHFFVVVSFWMSTFCMFCISIFSYFLLLNKKMMSVEIQWIMCYLIHAHRSWWELQ